MPFPEITLATQTIHNPNEPRHLMRVKPVSRKIRIYRDGRLIAESTQAMRVTEVGKDVYDPVIYLPKSDVIATLAPIDDKTSHCPLKGDAHYYSVDETGAAIVWSYTRTLDFAAILDGLVAFYPDEVTTEEIGANA